tara:strand:+ start:972 stop:1205 length:234 start_codon:yes stop_codon:yes gene_type:complete
VLGEWTVLIEDVDLTKEVEEMLAKLEISPVWMELILPYVLRGGAEVYEKDDTFQDPKSFKQYQSRRGAHEKAGFNLS